MKVVIFTVCTAIAAAGVYFHGPLREANVFPMPVDAVYAKLRNNPLPKNTDGQTAAQIGRTVTGVPGKSVTWRTNGSHSAYECTAKLFAVDANTTRIIPECEGGGAGDGAAAGMTLNLVVNSFIERLDAMMNDRAYDKTRAFGATAALWPKQHIENADIFSAQAEALRMDAEMSKMKANRN